ncbi:antibiotic biosynthesis monooxygenase [Streptomyces caniscabiei]|uniref:antibiotic biosynthesis monooxygenase n=1 Tax=Streptomyces caniscabiei TaxID=2746961 RepID=UPI000A395970|nr:antibiotic biosynthesis monooxygenase [Streptomyces caniscabiei]
MPLGGADLPGTEEGRPDVRAVEAIADTWERRPWPAAGLLGYFVYTAEDGSGLLHHSQWADEQAYDAFVKTHRQERNDAIDTAVPGIERVGLARYRRYRSLTAAGQGRPARVPGCVVIVDVRFDGPDPARQRAWVDAVEDALAAEPDAHPGGISAHFHLGTDGTRVLNYAEWETAQHHIDALAAPGDGVGSPSPLWQRVQNWPGLLSTGSVKRYEYALGLVPD